MIGCIKTMKVVGETFFQSKYFQISQLFIGLLLFFPQWKIAPQRKLNYNILVYWYKPHSVFCSTWINKSMLKPFCVMRSNKTLQEGSKSLKILLEAAVT